MKKINGEMIRKLSIEKLDYGSGYLVTFSYRTNISTNIGTELYSPGGTKRVAVGSLEEALSLFKEDKQ